MIGTPKGATSHSADSDPAQHTWQADELWSYPATALLTGTMGSLLGIGGGMVIGPVLLQLNLPPQVRGDAGREKEGGSESEGGTEGTDGRMEGRREGRREAGRSFLLTGR